MGFGLGRLTLGWGSGGARYGLLIISDSEEAYDDNGEYVIVAQSAIDRLNSALGLM